MIAAGRKATTSPIATVRPSAERPITPCNTDRIRRRYKMSTARMAPAWITIAKLSAGALVAWVSPTPNSCWET